MVDTNCAWTPAEAEAAVTAMAPSKPFWVEEPIYPPEDLEALARLRAATGIAMGVGENASSLIDFRNIVTVGKADYVQPSLVKIGITGMAKVAAEVERLGAVCTPNAFYIGPAYLAALHCVAAKEKDLAARAHVRRFRLHAVCQDGAGDRRRHRGAARAWPRRRSGGRAD